MQILRVIIQILRIIMQILRIIMSNVNDKTTIEKSYVTRLISHLSVKLLNFKSREREFLTKRLLVLSQDKTTVL